MPLSGKRIGFALTGSFCTFARVFLQVEALVMAGAQVVPILSEHAYEMSTRFFPAEDVRAYLSRVTGHEPLHTLSEVEPIGPKKLLDLLVIAPCTGNTLAKLATGVTDTAVTLAAKAHLRNSRPLLLGISTNDGLANAAKNIGQLLNAKHVFFIPFGQDDAVHKPNSIVAVMEQLMPAAEAALRGEQMQPVLVDARVAH